MSQISQEYGMNRKIIKLTIPNIISNISGPLLGMGDLAIVGSIGDKSYIGAIAIATIIFNFVYWGFGFLRMGTSAFASQAIGSRDLEECTRVMARGLIVASIASSVIMLLQYPIFSLSAEIMNTTFGQHLLRLCSTYLKDGLSGCKIQKRLCGCP